MLNSLFKIFIVDAKSKLVNKILFVLHLKFVLVINKCIDLNNNQTMSPEFINCLLNFHNNTKIEYLILHLTQEK